MPSFGNTMVKPGFIQQEEEEKVASHNMLDGASSPLFELKAEEPNFNNFDSEILEEDTFDQPHELPLSKHMPREGLSNS